MKYEYVGTILKAGCTPQPTTIFDNRSCRERNPNCQWECRPTVTCDICGKQKRTLNGLKEIETGKTIKACDDCRKELED